ncbi:MAG: acyltransferase [Bacteroidales bacterium]|nr:acyltransferase [Bacteroidales bacterium]
MRNEKLDMFRGLAMIWVIFNHTTYWLGFYYYTHWPAIIKSWLLIGTQLFFFIAGASNGMARKKNLPEFYLIRFKRILFPYWVYALICIIITCFTIHFTSSSHFFYFIKAALYSWFIAFNHQWCWGTGMVSWALWFVSVYLLVMLLFPFLRKFYEKFITLKIRIIPLVLLAILVFLLQFEWGIGEKLLGHSKMVFLLPFEWSIGEKLLGHSKMVSLLPFEWGIGERLLEHSKMVSFYAFFTYLGLFFTEIFEKRKTGIAIIIASICMVATVLSIIFLNQSPNMQANKFPPNFLFLIYSLGFLTILYIFSDSIFKFITYIKKNTILNWIYTQYVKHGVTIFLFHPFVFLLLVWLQKSIFHGVREIIVLIVMLLLSIPLSAVIGYLFSWVEKIPIPFYKPKKNI